MNASDRNTLRPPFAWFGGKQWLAKRIHNYMPSHKRYVDLFAGSACILFAKPRVPIEVINDLDSGVVNFYRVLRDVEKYPELQRLVSLTPYSREEFKHCSIHWEDYSDDVLRAWAWFVAARQARNGLYGSSWSRQTKDSRMGISMNVSRWLSGIDDLPEVYKRLQGVQIEHQDFRKIVPKFDSPQTWFYADPPYVQSTRSETRYHEDMTDGDHLDLVSLLLNLEGMCLLSGYKTSIYEPLESNGWKREEIKTVCFSTHIIRSEPGEEGNVRPPRTECLWLSPNLQKALEQEWLNLDKAA
jgi:DNA adenine methylase